MLKPNPILVYVGDASRAAAFMSASGWTVFTAPTTRDALAQTLFSYPDAIIIDAAHDMLRAEDTYFHLRTINHPSMVLLSNMPLRWELPEDNSVQVLAENTALVDVVDTLRHMLAGETEKVPC